MIMNSWKTVTTQHDIDELYDSYYGFHDACIVSVSYQSGTFADNEGTMYFSDAASHKMLVVFHSQMALKKLELLFCGVRQAHLIGWEDYYSSELCDAYLSFVHGLLPCKPERQIVWSSCGEFDPNKIENSLHELAYNYIVANELR